MFFSFLTFFFFSNPPPLLIYVQARPPKVNPTVHVLVPTDAEAGERDVGGWDAELEGRGRAGGD